MDDADETQYPEIVWTSVSDQITSTPRIDYHGIMIQLSCVMFGEDANYGHMAMWWNHQEKIEHYKTISFPIMSMDIGQAQCELALHAMVDEINVHLAKMNRIIDVVDHVLNKPRVAS